MRLQSSIKLHPFVLLLLSSIGIAIQFAVDASLQFNLLGRREFTALLDPVAHAALALIVVLPWIVLARLPRYYAILAVAAAVLIDLDHFIVATSLSLKDAISLPMRPMSHSVIFCAGLAGLLGVIFRQFSAGAIIFLALLSHLSRDATSGGTPWLFPFPESPRLSVSLHLVIWSTVILLGVLLSTLQPKKAKLS